LLSIPQDKINEEIKKALAVSVYDDTELDFVTTMALLKSIDRNGKEFKNNSEFVQLVLGQKTFKKYTTLGFIRDGGFYIHDGKVHDTCTTTGRYRAWDRILQTKKIRGNLLSLFKRK